MQKKGQAPVVVPSKNSLKQKKARAPWTLDTAQAFVKKSTKSGSKGLRYWSAVDYLKKVHNIVVE